MNYLSPEIAKMAKKMPEKSLAKKGVSCGIFQDIGKDPLKDIIRHEH